MRFKQRIRHLVASVITKGLMTTAVRRLKEMTELQFKGTDSGSVLLKLLKVNVVEVTLYLLSLRHQCTLPRCQLQSLLREE